MRPPPVTAPANAVWKGIGGAVLLKNPSLSSSIASKSRRSRRLARVACSVLTGLCVLLLGLMAIINTWNFVSVMWPMLREAHNDNANHLDALATLYLPSIQRRICNPSSSDHIHISSSHPTPIVEMMIATNTNDTLAKEDHLIRLESSNEDHIIDNNEVANTTTTSTVVGDSAIFYNVFINQSNPADGIRIAEEHTLQMYQSLLLEAQQLYPNNTSHHHQLRLPPLYYNMIGLNYTKRFCPKQMTCIRLNYYPHAFEEVTLQELYTYCTTHPSHHMVYYVHNKGSFSPMIQNEVIRRRETDFLFQHGRATMMMQKQQQQQHCNVVGMEFEPFPHWSFPSNFWMAKCSYVQQLIPPQQFAKVRGRMFQRLLHPFHATMKSPLYCLTHFFHMRKNGNSNNNKHADKNTNNDTNNHTMTDLFPEELQIVLGTGRWHNEVWIHSHPDVMPCDKYDTIFTSTLTNFSTSIHKKFWGGKQGLLHYEWFRLHGRLFEFYQLYQRLPSPASSFYYRYYKGTETPRMPKECRRGKGRDLKAYFAPRDNNKRRKVVS